MEADREKSPLGVRDFEWKLTEMRLGALNRNLVDFSGYAL